MSRQMCVLYAFMRHTDDLGDREDLSIDQRRALLKQWRTDVQSALAGGDGAHPLLPALGDVVQKCQIPEEHLQEVISGVESDLDLETFSTFEQLEKYCYQVAGVVGLCCLKIWGYRNDEAIPAAIACGTAFQLTNILRDLREDAGRGRVYLPQEELARFGVSFDQIRSGEVTPEFRELMRLQVARAWDFYHRAAPLYHDLSSSGQRIFVAFCEVYSSLLKEIERADYDVLTRRISLARLKKGWIALRCLLRIPSGAPRFLERNPVPAESH